ncbi:hypothetical protein STEG23_016032, partial [Scotinomys teguina]
DAGKQSPCGWHLNNQVRSHHGHLLFSSSLKILRHCILIASSPGWLVAAQWDGQLSRRMEQLKGASYCEKQKIKDNQTATVDHQAATADNQTATVDNQTATADNQTATADNQIATADNQTVTVDHQAATADNQTVTADNQTVTVDHQAATADNQTVTADNQIAIAQAARRRCGPDLGLYAAAAAVPSEPGTKQGTESHVIVQAQVILKLKKKPDVDISWHGEPSPYYPKVGLLRQKLDSLEKCNLVMTQNYEGQLQTLKAQFSKLTNNFEKLRLHQMKQNQAHRKEAPRKEETPFELSSLNQKLEEFRAKSREWDKQEILYQTHLVSLDAQQKLLSEKCNQFQKQAQNYQTQLNGKKQCPEDSSPEIPRLVCESDLACEASQRDEFIIEKLKSAVSEIALSRNKLQDENQKLLQELKMYQRQCQ